MSAVAFGIKKISNLVKIGNYTSIFVLVDEHTKKHCLPLLKPLLPAFQIILIKSGEQNKSIETCAFIWEALVAKAADRHALIINLGGGVITDMGAFCAATYMRGIAFVNIPTTLLAMCDAAIGGKTGVDFGKAKNLIGLFSDPLQVIIDSKFLDTLPKRQLLSASAELFKHALLQGKTQVKNQLKQPFLNASEKDMDKLVRSAIRFKTAVVATDLLDHDARKQLNLGHTIGHALEGYFVFNKKPILHGEAVALGLVAEAFIAHTYFNLEYNCFLNILFWYDLNFKKPYLTDMNFGSIYELMRGDKKNKNGRIKMVLLEKEGIAAVDVEVNSTQIHVALKFLATF